MLVLALFGCGGDVVRNVAGDESFVRWPEDDVVLVGSSTGLEVVDVATMTSTSVSSAPVIAAGLDGDGNLLFTESVLSDGGVVCAANCELDLQRADLDGSNAEVVVPGVIANLYDTFVQSTDRRFLAYQTSAGLSVRDLETGDVATGEYGTWVMDVADDGSEAMYLQSWSPMEEPWQHFLLFDAATLGAAAVSIDDDPNAIWTWRYRDADHHALLLDDGDVAVASLATGAREWTWTGDDLVNAGTLSFAPDGRWLSFFTLDDRLHVLDAATGAETATVRHRLGNDVWSGQSAVSPDGSRVAFVIGSDLFVEDAS